MIRFRQFSSRASRKNNPSLSLYHIERVHSNFAQTTVSRTGWQEANPKVGIAGMLRRYVRDLRQVVRENFRVLRPGGKTIYIVGNCDLRNTFVENSKCVTALANEVRLEVCSARKRPLPQNRRYLPPPGKRGAGAALHKRMREEVVLTMVKK